MEQLITEIIEATERKKHGQVTRVYFSWRGWCSFLQDLGPEMRTTDRPLILTPFYGAELFVVKDDRHPDYVVA